MAEVGIRALKQTASAVVARAAAGEVVTITDRGKPEAQLTPIRRSKLDALAEAGLVSRPTGRLHELSAPARLRDEKSLSAVLADMRDDERA